MNQEPAYLREERVTYRNTTIWQYVTLTGHVIYWLYVGRPAETDHYIWSAMDRLNGIVTGLILFPGFIPLTSSTFYLKKSDVTFYYYYYYYYYYNISEQTP
jgi:hypothetical protein